MPKISVIVPVYNEELYLKQCLDSIINQTFHDFEVICINDGSTDNSLKILEEYTLKDNRFRLINKKNEGFPIVRNISINEAKGDYIQFVDSDDWLEPQCLELTYNKILETNADFVCFAHNIYLNKNFYGSNQKSFLEYQKHKSINQSVEILNICWDKLFKKSFIVNNNIFCPTEPHLYYIADEIFNIRCFYNYPKFECISSPLYNYRVWKGNASENIKNAITVESYAVEYWVNQKEYQDSNTNLKIIAINKFCNSVLGWKKIYEYKKEPTLNNQLKNFLCVLENNIDKTLLNSCFYYIKLKNNKKSTGILNKIFKYFFH